MEPTSGALISSIPLSEKGTREGAFYVSLPAGGLVGKRVDSRLIAPKIAPKFSITYLAVCAVARLVRRGLRSGPSLSTYRLGVLEQPRCGVVGSPP